MTKDLQETLRLLSEAEDSAEEKNMRHINFLRYLVTNPNNFSYWFPTIRHLRADGIGIPTSIVIDVPEPVYRCFFLERENDRKEINEWVAKALMPVITEVFSGQDVFMKNGCFSNKFSFDKSCHIHNGEDASSVADKLLSIMYDALCMETYGYLEVVLREWIKPVDDFGSIYGGMPLRPEIRLFYDFTEKKVLYFVNYWDWDYCHDRICEKPGDKAVYEANYQKLNDWLLALYEKHRPLIEKALATVELKGMWSVDFILQEDKPILIDMALANRSAYWNPQKAGLDG